MFMKRLYFRIKVILALTVAAAMDNAALAQADPEEVDWITARADGTIDAFERYLVRHPFGKYADEAFYFVTVLAMDVERDLSRIEPGAGPNTLSEGGGLAAGLAVY